MVFHIEGNSQWAHKLNNKMRKCYEALENNLRQNRDDQKESVDGEDFIIEFVKVAEDVESGFDFVKEIKTKKENEKLKMIMEI